MSFSCTWTIHFFFLAAVTSLWSTQTQVFLSYIVVAALVRTFKKLNVRLVYPFQMQLKRMVSLLYCSFTL